MFIAGKGARCFFASCFYILFRHNINNSILIRFKIFFLEREEDPAPRWAASVVRAHHRGGANMHRHQWRHWPPVETLETMEKVEALATVETSTI